MIEGGRYQIVEGASFLAALSKQNLGNEFEISSTTPSVDEEICRVQMPAQFARGWIVTLGAPVRRQPVVGIGTPGTRAFATVAWGTAGVQHSVEVDWGRGMRLGMFASQVTVRLKAQAVSKVTVSAGAITYAASVSMGNWSGLDSSVVLTRSFIGTQNDGDPGLDAGVIGDPVQVPPFARSVHVCKVNSAVPPASGREDYDVTQRTGGISPVSCVTEFASAPAAGSHPQLGAPWWIPLTTDVMSITVTNTNSPPNDWERYEVIFALGL